MTNAGVGAEQGKNSSESQDHFDTVIVGSGFSGSNVRVIFERRGC